MLAGSDSNEAVSFSISCDEDGNPIVQVFNPSGCGPEALGSGGVISLTPDVYDSRRRAPAALVGTYTMAIPGADLDDGPARGLGDSVAYVVLTRFGTVSLRGVKAVGRGFTGTAQLTQDGTAPFFIPLYPGRVKGSVSGEMLFDPENGEGSLTGTATWVKPPGIATFAEPEEFTATGPIVGGFYTPDELPANDAYDFSFGASTPLLGTGAATVPFNASLNRFTLAGTLTGGGAITLGSTFTRATGLIAGARPRTATTGPSAWSGVLLQEQGTIAGSVIFTDSGTGEKYAAPVAGTPAP